jgi:tetratricopeptide (TPR) repeat protein
MMKDGNTKTQTVMSEDFDGLRVKVETGSAGLRWKDVLSIKYASADKYNEAIGQFDARKYAAAQPLLETLAADSKLRPVLKHNVLYFLGLTYQRQGNADQAIAKYQELVKTYPKSRYLANVAANLLQIYFARNDLAGAQGVLDTSLAAAQQAGMDTAQQAAFGVLKGKLQEQQKKYSDALTTYDTTAIVANADPDVVAEAKLGGGRAAQALQRTADAERRYNELKTADAPNSVLAGAWNGLGDISLAAAMASKSPEAMQDTVLMYLRGVVYYVPEGDGSTEELERSLCGAANAFKYVSQLDPNAANKKTAAARSKMHADTLKRDFPQSPYIAKLL